MKGMKETNVYVARDRIEAEILVDILNKNGIPAYRQGLGVAGILDIYAGNSTFGEEIYVDETDVNAALELITGVVLEAECEDDERN